MAAVPDSCQFRSVLGTQKYPLEQNFSSAENRHRPPFFFHHGAQRARFTRAYRHKKHHTANKIQVRCAYTCCVRVSESIILFKPSLKPEINRTAADLIRMPLHRTRSRPFWSPELSSGHTCFSSFFKLDSFFLRSAERPRGVEPRAA